MYSVFDVKAPFQTYFLLERFYDEIESGKEFSQRVDWLKLAKAADEAQVSK